MQLHFIAFYVVSLISILYFYFSNKMGVFTMAESKVKVRTCKNSITSSGDIVDV